MNRKTLYNLWILGFLLKSTGALWDVSYHFKYLRELYQIPHLLNAFGDVFVLFVLFSLWKRESQKERGSLKIIFFGVFVFIFGIFFDQWYHTRFGIDLTIWSPAHVTLYTGTGITIFGVIMQIARDHRRKLLPSSLLRVYFFIFFVFLLDLFWFLLLQQEQGVIASYLFSKGTPLASEELLRFVKDIDATISGGIPLWVYGAWSSFSAIVVFNLAKIFNRQKFFVTAMAGAYLMLRIFMNAILAAVSYQTSTIPYGLLMAAIIFDIFYLYEGKIVSSFSAKIYISSVLVVFSLYSINIFNSIIPPISPPMPYESILYSFVAGFLASVFVIGFSRILPVLETKA